MMGQEHGPGSPPGTWPAVSVLSMDGNGMLVSPLRGDGMGCVGGDVEQVIVEVDKKRN